MAINAYTGLMGSGKSYEVVENVILPALRSGRRVVTNVANLQQDDIRAYLIEKFDVAADKIGQIVQVLNDDIERPDFFPVEVQPGEIPSDSIVKAGDLVVVDECWRWWAAGAKISSAHMTFFRMHRHFVNPETLATCDMVLVVQDISDLDRKLKVVVENTYRMSKHKSLGLSKRYRVDIYSGYKVRGNPIRQLQRQYNKEIFNLYQSYSQSGGVGGKEVAIDDRNNIFKGALFKFVLPFFLIVFIVGFWWLWKFFHPVPKVDPKASAKLSSDKVVAAGAPAKASSSGGFSDRWRIAGHFVKDGMFVVVLVDQANLYRYIYNPPNFRLSGRSLNVVDDKGEVFTTFSGAVASPSMMPK